MIKEEQQDPELLYSCYICKKGSSHPVVTECGHIFCWNCLYRQTRENPQCPLCRRIIEIAKSYPMFIQNEQSEANENEAIHPRPAPVFANKIFNPSMASGGMPLGISNLSHNISRQRIVAGVTNLSPPFINSFISIQEPRNNESDYSIFRKCKIISSAFIMLMVAIMIAILIL